MSETPQEQKFPDPEENELPETECSETRASEGELTPDESREETEVVPAEAQATPAEEIPGWLIEFGSETRVQAEAETSAEELPEWLREGAGVKPRGESKADPAEELPEWLQEDANVEPLDGSQAKSTEELPEGATEDDRIEQQVETEAEPAKDVPEWLLELRSRSIQVEAEVVDTEEEMAPDGIDDSGVQVAAEAKPAEELPEWLQEVGDIDLQGEAEAETGAVEAEPAKDAPAWLLERRSKAIQEGAKEVSPEEEAAQERIDDTGLRVAAEAASVDDAPAWLHEIVEDVGREAETEKKASAAEEMPAKDVPAWLYEIVEDVVQEGEAETRVSIAEVEPDEQLPEWLQEVDDIDLQVEAETRAGAAEAEPDAELPEWLLEAGRIEPRVEAQAESAKDAPEWLHQIVDDVEREAETGVIEVEVEPDEELPEWLQGIGGTELLQAEAETGALTVEAAPADEIDAGVPEGEEPDPLTEARRALVDEELARQQEEDKKPGLLAKVTAGLSLVTRPLRPARESEADKALELETEPTEESVSQELAVTSPEISGELLPGRVDQGVEDLLYEGEAPSGELEVSIDEAPDETSVVEQIEESAVEELQQESIVDWEIEAEQEEDTIAGIEPEFADGAIEAERWEDEVSQALDEIERKSLLSRLLWWRQGQRLQDILSDQDIERRLRLSQEEGTVLTEDSVAEDSSQYLSDVEELQASEILPWPETEVEAVEEQVSGVQPWIEPETEVETVEERGPDVQPWIEPEKDIEVAEEETPEELESLRLLDSQAYDDQQVDEELAQLFLLGEVAEQVTEEIAVPPGAFPEGLEGERGVESYQDIRGVALEDYVELPMLPEDDVSRSLAQRIRVWVGELNPVQKVLLLGLISLDVILIVFGAVFIAYNLLPTMAVQPVVPPTATPLVKVPVPVEVRLPGGWSFELERGMVEEGIWIPQGAEWLEGTEIRRWVALPWNEQLEAVFRTFEPGDQIELTMSNADHLVYEVQSFQKVSVHQLDELNTNTPSLLLILANQDSDARLVVIAEP